jgi:hypothetical protein
VLQPDCGSPLAHSTTDHPIGTCHTLPETLTSDDGLACTWVCPGSCRHKAARVEGVVNLSGRDKFAAVPMRCNLDDTARLLITANVHRTAVIAKREDNVCIEGIITQVGHGPPPTLPHTSTNFATQAADLHSQVHVTHATQPTPHGWA